MQHSRLHQRPLQASQQHECTLEDGGVLAGHSHDGESRGLIPILDLEAEVDSCESQLSEVGEHLVSDRIGEALFSELGKMVSAGNELAQKISVLEPNHIM